MSPMRNRSVIVVGLVTAALLAAQPASLAKEPDVVVVQHILIGFKKTVPGQELERTKKDARALVDDLLQRAGDGADFDALVKEYTNDSYPGIFKLTNTRAPLLPDARQRKEMVAAFGDVSFRLDVGEIGVAKYNSVTSPYGWHIIKRLE